MCSFFYLCFLNLRTVLRFPLAQPKCFSKTAWRSCAAVLKWVTKHQVATLAAAGVLCGTAMLITNCKGGAAYENDRLYLHGLSAKVRHSPPKRADRGADRPHRL